VAAGRGDSSKREVQLAPQLIVIIAVNFINVIMPLLLLTFGGMGLLPQSRGGACFCTRGAMQGCDVILFILALAKTVTPGRGPRRQPGQAVPLTT